MVSVNTSVYITCIISVERSVRGDKLWQEASSLTVSVRYTVTEMLLIGHSERQQKVDYLNEHNIHSVILIK